jgi:probable phosphoglycerate mutase
MRLYFVRHGESEANLTRTFSNRDAPHPLTPLGREQAEALAARVAGETIDHLYCSPIQRAVQTAEIVGRRIGLAPVPAEALREYDVGEWEGTSDPAGWAEYDEVLAAWLSGRSERRVSSGESLIEIQARFAAFIRGLCEKHGNDQRILMVSHGGLLHVALPAVIPGLDLSFCLANRLGHGDLVVCEAGGDGLRCESWADAPVPAKPAIPPAAR